MGQMLAKLQLKTYLASIDANTLFYLSSLLFFFKEIIFSHFIGHI